MQPTWVNTPRSPRPLSGTHSSPLVQWVRIPLCFRSTTLSMFAPSLPHPPLAIVQFVRLVSSAPSLYRFQLLPSSLFSLLAQFLPLP